MPVNIKMPKLQDDGGELEFSINVSSQSSPVRGTSARKRKGKAIGGKKSQIKVEQQLPCPDYITNPELENMTK